MESSFIPNILIFCCQNSVSSPKKLVEEFENPEYIQVVEFPCTGKMEASYALQAFEKGVDGVCVIGCMEGECHYLEGNLRAVKRVHQIAVILDELKLGRERVAMLHADSSRSDQFKQSAGDFIHRIQGLGPNPLKKRH
jgi:F420-non-reducing hydrogenase iron-sulfur subunit